MCLLEFIVCSWAYCAHSTGIGTPLQKMHDDKISKVYMWIIVEEVRAHRSVMA